MEEYYWVKGTSRKERVQEKKHDGPIYSEGLSQVRVGVIS